MGTPASGLLGLGVGATMELLAMKGTDTPSTFRSAVFDRDQHDVILILSVAGLSLLGEHADHAEREIFHPDFSPTGFWSWPNRLATTVCPSKQTRGGVSRIIRGKGCGPAPPASREFSNS